MCQFFYCLDIFFKQNVNEIFYIVSLTLYILWWSTRWSSLNQISSYNPFSIDVKIRASLCIINKEMKDVFVCYAREEEEKKRNYIDVKAAWPPRSCCFLCNVLYKFYGIVIIKQTPYAGLFPSICYLYLGFLLV